jgi:threonine synthase
MADVKSEAEEALNNFQLVATAGDTREAIAYAYRGLSGLLVSVLFELREIKEELYTQGSMRPDA